MNVDIQLTTSQLNFIKSKSKFAFFTGGYKAGKTWVLVEKAINMLITTRQNGLVAEPSYRMTRDLLIPEFEKSFRLHGINYTFKVSDNIFITDFGNIIIRTLAKRDALEGHNLGWFGLDEIDLLSKRHAIDCWNTLLSKLILGEKRYGFGAGTNEGFEFIYEYFYNNAEIKEEKEKISEKSKLTYSVKSYKHGDYELFISPTLENEWNLPDDYIQTLNNNYDSKLIQRYMYGDFVNIRSGLIYYKFDRAKHLIDCEFNPKRKTIMAWDVNYSQAPMSTVLIQEVAPYDLFQNTRSDISKTDMVYVVVKEFVSPYTNTQPQCMKIYEYLKEREFVGDLWVTGDYSGNNRSVGATQSHYSIVDGYFKDFKNYRGTRTWKTRHIEDRTNATNMLFENGKNIIHLFIDKDCKKLTEDLEQVVWKENKNEIDDSNISLTHVSDAMSYFSANWKPIRGENVVSSMSQ